MIQSASAQAHLSSNDEYDLGMAFARLREWPAARAALKSGFRRCRRQKRFPLELAGVAIETRRYPEAASWLHRALRLDRHDAYALNFAATVYFLQGNLDAALKYWNLVHKPFVETLQFDPQLRIHRLLLDRSFAFAPASVLERPEYTATITRLTDLGIFPTFSINLVAAKNGSFAAEFHAVERNGIGNSRIGALLSTFGGVFYQTVYPAWFNAGRSAINLEALLRWDEQKRRAWLEASGPLRGLPQWRWKLMTDERDENWIVRSSFTGPAPPLGALNLGRQVAAASLSASPRGTLQWSVGAEFSHRTFRDVQYGSAITPQLAASGYQIQQSATIRGRLIDIPERRFSVELAADSQLARLWSSPPRVYEKLQGSALAHWFPQSSGDRYELREQVRAGQTFGHAPFDQLYMLGVERDNDLWLRGLIGTRDGRKGSSPLGDGYLLSNSGFNRRLYSNGLFTARIGPWFDTGRSYAPIAALSPPHWLFNVGAEARLTVLGTGVVLTYGRDIRTGTNAVFATLAGR